MKPVAISLLALAAALGVVRPAGAEALGIDEVARLVVSSGPALAAERERADSAEAQSRSARGRLLPSVHVSDEYQRWDRPFPIPFKIPGAPAGAGGNLREINTNTFAVAVRQPLLGLLHGTHEYDARGASAEAAKVGVRTSESAMREAAELEYLRLFEAKARADIARASESELAQEVAETAARVKAGTLTNADLLRVQVAQASARQQGIVAEADATVSRANLLAAIGRSPDDTSVEFKPPTALLGQADAPVPSSGDAASRRPEIGQAKLRAEAAGHEESAKGYALLPEIDLEAAYSHIDGQAFAQTNSAFVGIKADWAVWEWGATYSAKQAASAEARAAALDVEATARRIRAEVAGRKAELGAAGSAVGLARQTIASAEEAYRVTEAQVRAGTGTTTDLLNAESALTESRLRLENARYAQAAARIRLLRAAGLR